MAIGSIDRKPEEDAGCVGGYGAGSQGYTVAVNYTDPDGDARGGGVTFFGGEITSDATFSGDGSSGSFTHVICAVPGDPVEFAMTDGAGNASNTATGTTP